MKTSRTDPGQPPPARRDIPVRLRPFPYPLAVRDDFGGQARGELRDTTEHDFLVMNFRPDLTANTVG